MSNRQFNRRIKILWHGEFGFNTGFAGVSENILDRLYSVKTEWGTPKFEIAVMALGQGMNPYDNADKKPYKIIPMYGDRRSNPYGQDYASDVIQKFRPDIVVSFGDTWMVDFWNDSGKISPDLRKTFKLVSYVAIDGYPVPPDWINRYKNFDKLIAFTEFGKNSIEERAKSMGVKLDVSHIYHGVDNQVFKPLPKTQVEQFKEQKGLKGKKIIGMFSRNQPRKHHPEFLEFAQSFARKVLEKSGNDPDIMFYLHCVERDAGWDLPALLEDIDDLRLRERFLKYGTVGPGQEYDKDGPKIKDKFFFPGVTNPAQGLPVELLNMMYNICDAHMLLTSGEGFGCTLLESMSAGTPTFTNDYAAGAELVKVSGGGEVITAREFTYRGSDHNFYRPHTDYNDAADKILKTLECSDCSKKYSKSAKAFAMGMSWDIINDDWDRELSELYDLDPSKEQKAEAV